MRRFLVIFTAIAMGTASDMAVETPTSPPSYDRAFTLFLNFPRQQFGGDFDGNRFYLGPDALVVVPDVDPAWGIGIGGGIKSRVSDNLAVGIDVVFNSAQHDVTWFGAPGEASSFHVDIDFKLFLNARDRAQAYLLSGFSNSRLTVKDGHLTVSEAKDVTFTGRGFHIGTGLNYYLSPRVSLNTSLRHRWMSFDEIDFGDRSKIEPKLKSTAVDAALALAYHFKLGQ